MLFYKNLYFSKFEYILRYILTRYINDNTTNYNNYLDFEYNCFDIRYNQNQIIKNGIIKEL